MRWLERPKGGTGYGRSLTTIGRPVYGHDETANRLRPWVMFRRRLSMPAKCWPGIADKVKDLDASPELKATLDGAAE